MDSVRPQVATSAHPTALSPEEVEGLRDVLSLVEQEAARIEAFTAELARQDPDLAELLQPADPAAAARRAANRELLRTGVEAANLESYLSAVREQARELAARGVRFHTVAAVFTRFTPLLSEMIVQRHRDDLPRMARALKAMERLVGLVVGVVGAEYAEVREGVLEAEYRKVLREISVPVVPVWDGVLVVPLIGVLDSSRAREMTEKLLEAIVERRASVAIVDITGVPAVDTQVADYLIRAVRAARLLGTTSVLVGIRPAIAQALVHLGVDLTAVHTEADLRSGLAYAFRILGYRILKEEAHA